MAEIIDMPKLSDTMTVGTLVSWLKNEGDPVKPGDMIAEVETDKATMELENFETGILLKQYVKAGEQVAVGARIAVIGQKGEAIPEDVGEVKKVAVKEVVKENVEVKEAQLITPEIHHEGRIFASPLARNMAKERGIKLEVLKGTGPHGRIVKADVLGFKPGGSSCCGSPSMPIALPTPFKIGEDKVIPVTNMRRAIAQHLVKSKSTIPHFYLDVEVDGGALLNLRNELNQHLSELPAEEGGIKFTVNDFILKATAEAIRKVPAINSSWDESVIRQYGSVHLAFGVAVEDGLVTPVIRDAQSKSLRQISIEAKEYANRARNKKLKPDEMSGSTFTVTNLGMFGINSFFGIINPPNAGILSVGAVMSKPVVDASGKIVVGQRMNIGFSGDHRVVDGAMGAQFLQVLKGIIEAPSVMLIA